jgi:hypothetical protein
MNPNEDNENFPPAKFKGQFSDDFESEMMLQKLFGQKTNQSPEAFAREIEIDILATSSPPVDLRAIPESERSSHDDCHVTIPDDIARYLDNAEFPLSPDEVNALEDKINAHHSVKPPSFIIMEPSFVHTGKTYTHIEELGKIRTGFVYRHL